MNRVISLFLLIIAISAGGYYIFSSNQDTARKPLHDKSVLGVKIAEDSKYALFKNKKKLYLREKSTGVNQILTMPEQSLILAKNITNKDKTIPPLIGTTIDSGYILKGKNNSYIIRRNPEFELLVTYPNTDVKGKFILVNKSQNRLYLYADNELMKKYIVSTGDKPWYTPEGEFLIDNKIEYPYGKDPHAPMGPRWMGLAVPYENDKRGNNTDGGPDERAPKGDKYGIHGTNDEKNIGTYQSGGCVRMYNQSVIELYDMVDIGTKVRIVK